MKIEKILQKTILILSILFVTLCVLFYFVFIFNKNYFNFSLELDTILAEQFGTFFSGFVGTTATIASSLLVVLVFLSQNKQSRISQLENIFYKMVDYHRENVKLVVFKSGDKCFYGQEAFVKLKLYLFKCQNQIIGITKKYNLSRHEILDLSFILFFFGIDKKWQSFYSEQLNKYSIDMINEIALQIGDNFNISTQTTLSPYFRNLYNAISIIHDNKDLSKNEKYNYIKLLRSQLSNNELCILYFDIMSRYGKKWKEKKIIEEYKFLKNLPPKFCNGFNPKDDFKIKYESEEYN